MSDFTSDFWAVYIALITVLSIIACAVLLYAYSTKRAVKGEQAGTTGHTWDEDLHEWNNPLPRWWMWLFYLTIVFSLVYLALSTRFLASRRSCDMFLFFYSIVYLTLLFSSMVLDMGAA